MDKRERAALFRDRLARAMAHAETNQSALARAAGANRSTVSQLLDDEICRLPNAQLAADFALILGVSADWLLGLTDRPERPGDLIEAAMQMTDAERTPSDDQIFEWHREAAGHKIRHVPATLPDMLKIEPLMRWEYAVSLGKTPDQAISAMQERLDWLRSGTSDYEIAIPLQELDALARGEGYYRGLELDTRREQLDRLAQLAHDLYPSLRIFLFDARRVFSAPITLFGPFVGVIYVGRFYLAFRERTRIKALSRHFDWLVREADVDGRSVAKHLTSLLDDDDGQHSAQTRSINP